MPSFIIKAEPDLDWYVYWSTVVDAPVANPGTRDQYVRAYDEERVARADNTGTSMCDPELAADRQWFGWLDDTISTAEGNPTPGQGWIWRRDLRAYVEAMIADDRPGMLAVHHIYDDDEEAGA